MRKLSLLLLLAFFALPNTNIAAKICQTDEALRSLGWVVHENNFDKWDKKTYKWLRTEWDQFERDGDPSRMVIYSSIARMMLRLHSFDHIATGDDVMIGDMVFFEGAMSPVPVEVRWFDGKDKHVAYNQEYTPCATNIIPLAENSLY